MKTSAAAAMIFLRRSAAESLLFGRTSDGSYTTRRLPSAADRPGPASGRRPRGGSAAGEPRDTLLQERLPALGEIRRGVARRGRGPDGRIVADDPAAGRGAQGQLRGREG